MNQQDIDKYRETKKIEQMMIDLGNKFYFKKWCLVYKRILWNILVYENSLENLCCLYGIVYKLNCKLIGLWTNKRHRKRAMTS